MQQKFHHTLPGLNSACSAYKSESDYSKRRDSYSVSRYATRETATASDVAELLARVKVVWQNFNFDADEKATALLQEEWYESLKSYTCAELTGAFAKCKEKLKQPPTIKDVIDAAKHTRADASEKVVYAHAAPAALFGNAAHLEHCDYLRKRYGIKAAEEYRAEHDKSLSFELAGRESEYIAGVLSSMRRFKERVASGGA